MLTQRFAGKKTFFFWSVRLSSAQHENKECSKLKNLLNQTRCEPTCIPQARLYLMDTSPRQEGII